jgi:hypothetical protein
LELVEVLPLAAAVGLVLELVVVLAWAVGLASLWAAAWESVVGLALAAEWRWVAVWACQWVVALVDESASP